MASLTQVSATASTWTDLSGGMTSGRTYQIEADAQFFRIAETASAPGATDSFATFRRPTETDHRCVLTYDGTNDPYGWAPVDVDFNIMEIA